MKRILCYGDSNTYGADGRRYRTEGMSLRYDEQTRWTALLQKNLGADYLISEEGFNGRTTVFDDPIENGRNGFAYLDVIFGSHQPLDLVILMLGSNDCKRKFSYSSMDIAGEMQILLEKILAYDRFRCGDQFKVLLVSPPHISEAITTSWLGDSFGYENGRKLSMELAAWYVQLAEMYGCMFLDAAEHVRTSDTDGCHMDAENQRKLARVLADLVKAL